MLRKFNDCQALLFCDFRFTFVFLHLFSLLQHFNQLAKDNQLSNDLRLDGGSNDDLNIGGVAAATEHMTLSGGEPQTLSFDD